ncbi:MAG: mannose-1-phosphate guanylyltransferase/mannose-6-phosphate isomerase [Gammaproteobacteria bacterium RIFCSPHIGHO2_02_FULL_39_13]|nr:MAG: mannose-1-phosphate guanylyltransferase/mannose-6-phosphate isomerase [Gammaproteobacteria bacterium RIFCSPHIGHO2_02_FULL_39_13]OGT48549.1 MAG: mannose-1-phosphate guanylyltransferase/mannose-6-phosphate isomerase [Gammaproteobacteria bacterium RIFCSPHIGHO2_12_FULL_39_24]
MKINPVILIGGSGTRLWPLSRANCPKQFVSFDGQYSLFQQTLLRIQKIKNINRTYLVVNESNYFLCLDQLHDLKINDITIIIEPEGRNTAPAVAITALVIPKNELMLVLPSDHKITNTDLFLETIQNAPHHTENKLILFGIKPSEPSTAYGYIQAEHAATTPAKVKTFFEKPSVENAKKLLVQSHCYWNSGMFLFSAEMILNEMMLYEPNIVNLAKITLKNTIVRNNSYYLSRNDFLKMPNIAIDVAVMEKTQVAFILALQSDWSDLGDWGAMYNHALTNERGNNVSIGNVFSVDTKNSYLHSHDKLLAVMGVDNLVVVASKDSVLIANKSKTQDVKTLVNSLMKNGYSHYLENDLKVHRPWGTYESVMRSPGFQVKHIVVKPGRKLSLQSHLYRSEHWVVVKGIADVVCGEKAFQIFENESTYIPKKTKHRLINNQTSPLELIEVQVGSYVGEDDIVRYDDAYGRVEILIE